jgi:hypothetical protein
MCRILFGLLFASSPPGERGGLVFVPDTRRWVAIQIGEFLSIGKLDQAGNFAPERQWLNMRGELSAVPPCTFDDEGRFVAELGSRVVDFKDYRYSKDALRIYNLPGYFVPKN